MTDIMTKFQIDATAIGVLSAAYYLGYAGLQIPVGIALDRLSPRTVISASALTCTLGTLSFIYSESWTLTLFGRFLIGAGSAAGFLGTAKVIRLGFSESKFTALMGLTFTFGLMGALYGGRPVSLLIDQMGWVSVLKILSLICFLIAVSVFLLFPKQDLAESSDQDDRNFSILGSLKEIIKERRILWVGIAGALLVGPLEGFADIWGISYLVNVYGFTKTDASLVTSCIYFGMLFGGPILSYVAQKTKAYYVVTALCALFMAAIFGGVLLTDLFASKVVLMASMTIVGILCCYQAVVFAIACRLAHPRLSGLATSVTNCINMSFGCLFHFAMGKIMDYQWSGAFENGIKVYDGASYSSAIAVIPIALVFGFFAFLLLRRNEEMITKPTPVQS